ncbi:MAG: hypothetical protein KDA24_00770 [Deltaproteobacteria bacterium]|nr:hypothetical protein [Deltaproteobacteria bacterium]
MSPGQRVHRRAVLLLALASLLTALPAAAETRARLLVRGNAAPGSEIPIQVELSWDGRPELMLPRVPTVEVPKGAALRLGTTGSRFDGDRSVWWTNGTITLPDRGGPYVLGPATIPVAGPDGSIAGEFVADARTMGRGRSRNLLGQGVASGGVLALALGLLMWGWRRLVREAQAPNPIVQQAAALQAALEGDSAEPAIDAALALHDALSAHAVAVDYLGERAGLEARREELRYGGAEVDMTTLAGEVRPLLAIAGALE